MRITKLLVASVTVLSLAACASTGNSYTHRAPASSPQGVDTARVAQVERAAYQRGLDVVWVHPPEKRRVD